MPPHRLGDHPKKGPRGIGAAVRASAIASVALLGCTAVVDPTGSPAPGSAGLEAFRASLYAFASPSTSCGRCHASAQVPLFASPDVGAAYAAARPLVDFANPTSSLFIVYAQNDHCGVSAVCGATSGNGAIVQQDLLRWASAETSGGGPPAQTLAYLTSSLPIPAISTLPTLMTGKTALLRFALSDLRPAVAPLANAVLELELVAANATEYRFSSPKIGGSTAAVQLQGVHVLVKPSSVVGPGSEDMNQGDTWDAIAASIPVSTLPSPLPTTPLAVAPLDTRAIAVGAYTSDGVVNDTITVGFDLLN